MSPYAEAYDQITDKSFARFKHAAEINRDLTHLSRLDNFDWQPPAIEVIAKRRESPEFIFRFLSDLERLAYGLFLMRSDPSERIRLTEGFSLPFRPVTTCSLSSRLSS
ncbi:hypothetical protein P0R31_40150 [Bradyrhizobium yuanmingense]|uniref:hypothetical protein n=1 Tax=Bradyrhizobium yuanmingense TaxID=108015 RepID=UPI0023B9D3DE|nr:hypothetical protein [Bradyrhizobium yuanmingense]MDF0523387.1 hypothetical protein [Bradyrhizobium yuanmingense]